MSENTEPTNIPAQQLADDEINLLEYLLVIVKHKKMIFLTCLVTFLVTCGITLLMPNIYTSTARILPPQDSRGGLSSMLGGMSDLAALAGVSAGGGLGDMYVAMLKSRTISDAIIDKFGLMALFEWQYRTTAYQSLDAKVSISLGKKDGVISVSVEDENPELAAQIANAYIDELKQLNIRINLNNAGRERLFLEERLNIVKADLSEAENALKEFQEKNKAIRIDAQASAIIDAIAQLKGELASKEVELGVMLGSQTEQNPQIIALREGITQIKSQISRLERSPTGKKASDDIFLATSDVPELGVQYARLLRNFKVQETLFELLTKQYEISKINEAKNTSTIQVLDSAVVPDKKSKPKRSLIVLMVTFVAGFFSLLLAFFKEFTKNIKGRDKVLLSEIRTLMTFKNRSL